MALNLFEWQFLLCTFAPSLLDIPLTDVLKSMGIIKLLHWNGAAVGRARSTSPAACN